MTQVRIWDVYSGKLKKVFNGYMFIGIDVLLSPDGQTIARASWDGTIWLWDISTINQQKRLRK